MKKRQKGLVGTILSLALPLTFAFLALPLDSASASSQSLNSSLPSLKKSNPAQNLFLLRPVLRKVLGPGGQLHFQVCETKSKTCERLTRNISFQELQAEHLKLEKEMKNRFRAALPTGTVLFSDSLACTLGGAIIASVPGVAGGAMVCMNTGNQKMTITDLPMNLQALEQLAQELGKSTSVLAKGDDGEVYVANPDLIFAYLRDRYPVSL